MASAHCLELAVRLLPTNTANDFIVALQTIRILLSNILTNPEKEKYRIIRLGNRAIQKRIVDVTGALEFLCAHGFVHSESKGGNFLKLPLSHELSTAAKINATVASEASGMEGADKSGDAPGQDPFGFIRGLDWIDKQLAAHSNKKGKSKNGRPLADCLLRFRLPSGKCVCAAFGAAESLAAVHSFVGRCLLRGRDDEDFLLCSVAPPATEYGTTDARTLSEVGLVGRAVLTVRRAGGAGGNSLLDVRKVEEAAMERRRTVFQNAQRERTRKAEEVRRRLEEEKHAERKERAMTAREFQADRKEVALKQLWLRLAREKKAEKAAAVQNSMAPLSRNT